MPSNIIDRLVARLNGATSNRDMPDIGTRDYGGSYRLNHPHISGYFYAIFHLPQTLFAGVEEASTLWLSSVCESFAPPGENIGYTEIVGLGQKKSRFMTSRTVSSQDITLTFREYMNLPILNILNMWCSFLDPYVGASPFTGSQFIPANYKGTLYVMQCKPVGAYPGQHITAEDIEEAYVFDGVFPTSLPYDALNSDLGSNESVQLSVNFSFDGYPYRADTGSIDACLDAYRSLGHTSLMDGFENALVKQPRTLSGEPNV